MENIEKCKKKSTWVKKRQLKYRVEKLGKKIMQYDKESDQGAIKIKNEVKIFVVL
jgi:hypothetical protein